MIPQPPSISSFASAANMTTFWANVKMLLGFASPWVMISAAIFCVGLVLIIAVKAFTKASKNDREAENEDFEIRNY